MKDNNDKPMSIGEHLEELRKRLAFAILGVVPIFAVGLWYGHEILNFLVQPLLHALNEEDVAGAMQATQVLEGFLTYLKIGGVLAVVLGAPWIVYQLWKFIAPGLYARERRFVYVLAPMSIGFSVLGGAFMYYIMLPFALFFFVHFNDTLLHRPPTPIVEAAPETVIPAFPQFAGDPKEVHAGQIWINTERRAVRVAIWDPKAKTQADREKNPPRILSLPLQSDSFVVQQYKVGEYVSLVLTFGLAFAVAFQTPIVVLLLGWTGLMSRKTLASYRKYAILVCTLIAAAITPPDFWSMVSLLVPMYALFELGLLLLWILPARKVASGRLFTRGEARDGQDKSTDDPTARPDNK
jgi:sec-independent protein translocase protein TatC